MAKIYLICVILVQVSLCYGHPGWISGPNNDIIDYNMHGRYNPYFNTYPQYGTIFPFENTGYYNSGSGMNRPQDYIMHQLKQYDGPGKKYSVSSNSYSTTGDDGKLQAYKQAEIVVNDNGKITKYRGETPEEALKKFKDNKAEDSSEES